MKYDDTDDGHYSFDYPLHRAVKAGDLEGVRALLERGDSPNVYNEDEASVMPLHHAVRDNRAGIAALLLRYGADSEQSYYPHWDGSLINSTPLTMAMELGHAEVVRALVHGGTNPNAPNDEGDHPLCVAIKLKKLDVLQALLEAPTLDADAPDEGGIPGIFRFIAAHEHEAVAQLLDAGADPNAAHPTHGNSPLHEAARRNLAPLVELLLLYGARADARNHAGELPQELTRHPRTLSLLRAAQEAQRGQAEHPTLPTP